MPDNKPNYGGFPLTRNSAILDLKTTLLPAPIPNVGACAMFADLDGNVIGLFKS